MTEKKRAIAAAVNLILSITRHGDSPVEYLEKAVTAVMTELFETSFMMGYDEGYRDAEDVLDSAGL